MRSEIWSILVDKQIAGPETATALTERLEASYPQHLYQVHSLSALPLGNTGAVEVFIPMTQQVFRSEWAIGPDGVEKCRLVRETSLHANGILDDFLDDDSLDFDFENIESDSSYSKDVMACQGSIIVSRSKSWGVGHDLLRQRSQQRSQSWHIPSLSQGPEPPACNEEINHTSSSMLLFGGLTESSEDLHVEGISNKKLRSMPPTGYASIPLFGGLTESSEDLHSEET